MTRATRVIDFSSGRIVADAECAIELWAHDAPGANGREPQIGDSEVTFQIALGEGGEAPFARIHLSEYGARKLAEHFTAVTSGDEA